MASLLPRAARLPRSITAAPPPCTLARLFSSTSRAPSQRIPPESPLFINVPNPPQDQSIEAKREQKRVRGFVPVPRRIFPRRDGHEKATDEWLGRAAPEPRNKASQQSEPASELQAWKRRMAANRRENMRTGVRDLWARKQRLDSRRLAVRTAKLAANRAAALAPEREDERLTRGSINEGTLQTTVVRDPLRFKTALASAARTAAVAADKSEARRDAIQALYMNARSFIVSEGELETFVNKEFADDRFDRWGASSAGYRTENIWDLENEPMSVARMLKDVQRNSETLVADMTSEKTRTDRRQKRVAEELTGGKMD
ncbi:hypothetical protein F5Y12DRAFT_758577 [Xylaria sp. FL1777]|nr:hypothetical protein F5Y12DRAFT_758577 [Xylaria sp. FL1777]